MLRAGQAVAVPIPRASVALTAKIDLVSVTGSAAGRSAELFGMEISEQLPSPMAATDGYHYFAAMVEGAIVCPRPVSSPQIRRYPQGWLSRAISSASWRIAGPVRGRPGVRRG